MSTGNNGERSASAKGQTDQLSAARNEFQTCFVIMPITDPPDYESGHFKQVYEDLFISACHDAGYNALRADQVRATNLIHLDVLQQIIDSPMVLCDLSSRNPNVLFELGLRQAFDKPVVLVQEVGTPAIFDIAPLRYTNYRPSLIYRQVIEDQATIAAAIRATADAASDKRSVNSIVKLLSLTHSASLPISGELDKESAIIQVVLAELANLRSEIRSNGTSRRKRRFQIADLKLKSGSLEELRDDIDRAAHLVDQLVHDVIPPIDLSGEFENLQNRLDEVFVLTKDPHEVRSITILGNELIALMRRHDQYVRQQRKALSE
jgi:hypothetical protein